eukprot:TRINITY_DN11792_c0_g2_i11.p1 TRINITY_DN11792_c0_g2~~TRINITY_DN11792_c0_g2_i11.p1  ORF type:complete len:121 (+),score=15.05 TRINITY_DN11792_c0_g2_i11:574-936(+)
MDECARKYYLKHTPANFKTDPDDYDAYQACYRVGVAVKYVAAVVLSSENKEYQLEARRKGMAAAHDVALEWMTDETLGGTPQKKSNPNYKDHLTTMPMQCIQMVYANQLVGCKTCYGSKK